MEVTSDIFNAVSRMLPNIATDANYFFLSHCLSMVKDSHRALFVIHLEQDPSKAANFLPDHVYAIRVEECQ
jgi:hypothetical protein